MAVALMTKLDAVNKMLEAVWEQPVSTLDIPGVASVAMAKRILDETSRSVQSRGWAFNTEEDIVLAPDNGGKIVLGSNVLDCDTMGASRDIDVVIRGTPRSLYDRKNHTFVFSASLHTTQTLLFDFEELPETARTYIAVMAARVFRDKWQQRDQPASASPEEVEALRNLEESEAQQADLNMYTDSYSVACILER